jgi:hypothetical protein
MWFSVMVIVAAASGAPGGPRIKNTPLRTEVLPRIDPVFSDTRALRRSLDRFWSLHAEMEQVRSAFSTAVHSTLGLVAPRARGLGPPRSPSARGCPGGAMADYTRARRAGARYLALGHALESRYRTLQRSARLGESPGLTPDYRAKLHHTPARYLRLLEDLREMKVAFYDQLSNELRHVGCKLGRDTAAHQATESLDPMDPTAWNIKHPDDLESELPDAAAGSTNSPQGTPGETTKEAASEAAPSIAIAIDNAHCPGPSRISIDGALMARVDAGEKISVRTRAGPHELCILPVSDKRACGDPGTIRRVYLYEGFGLVVRCAK